jgi:hypothetical protein
MQGLVFCFCTNIRTYYCRTPFIPTVLATVFPNSLLNTSPKPSSQNTMCRWTWVTGRACAYTTNPNDPNGLAIPCEKSVFMAHGVHYNRRCKDVAPKAPHCDMTNQQRRSYEDIVNPANNLFTVIKPGTKPDSRNVNRRILDEKCPRCREMDVTDDGLMPVGKAS